MTPEQEITIAALKHHVDALTRRTHSATMYTRDTALKAKQAVRRTENAAKDLRWLEGELAAAEAAAVAYEKSVS